MFVTEQQRIHGDRPGAGGGQYLGTLCDFSRQFLPMENNSRGYKQKFRPRQDSNLQSPDSKSGALSIRPHDPSHFHLSVGRNYIISKHVANVLAGLSTSESKS